MQPFAKWCQLVVVAPVLLALMMATPYNWPAGLPGAPSLLGSLVGAPSNEVSSDDTGDEAVALQLVKRSSPNASSAGDADPGVRFIRNVNTLKELPKADKSLPKFMKGVFWLDEAGAYGVSTIPFEVDIDLAFSNGGASFDPKKRMTSLQLSGPSYTMYNGNRGYVCMKLCQLFSCRIEGWYNEDYSAAQLILAAVLPVIGDFRVPQEIIKWTVQNPVAGPGECPPPAGATKEQRSRCGQRRDSIMFGGFPLLKDLVAPSVYHIFQIGDEDHKPIQPYFDEYLRFADSDTSQPDPKAFKQTFGVHFPPEAGRKGLQILSTVPPAQPR